MTIFIIIITVIVSLYAFQNQAVNDKLIHNPYLVKHKNQWYRLITSGLLHADYGHLFVNMFVLYNYGRSVEHFYVFIFESAGLPLYVLLYFSAIYASSVPSQYKYQHAPYYNSLGASGAVSAILFTAILLDPLDRLYLMGIRGIGIPAIVFGLLYLGYSYYMSKQQNDNVNHDAHFYGAIYGMAFTLVFKPQIGLAFLNTLFGLGL